MKTGLLLALLFLVQGVLLGQDTTMIVMKNYNELLSNTKFNLWYYKTHDVTYYSVKCSSPDEDCFIGFTALNDSLFISESANSLRCRPRKKDPFNQNISCTVVPNSLVDTLNVKFWKVKMKFNANSGASPIVYLFESSFGVVGAITPHGYFYSESYENKDLVLRLLKR